MYDRRLEEKLSIFQLIFGSWKTMLSVTILSFIGFAYLIFTATPWYSAETVILLPSNPTPELADKPSAPYMPQTDPYLVKSYLDIIQNDDICIRVIKELHLVASPEFDAKNSLLGSALHYVKDLLAKGKTDLPPSSTAAAEINRVLATYKRHLKATNDGKSLILTLSYQAKDPTLAAKIVNAQAAAYGAAQIEYRSHEANIKSQWLKEQLVTAANEVKLAQIAIQLRAPLAGVRQSDAADQSAELKSRQAVATAKQAVYETLLSRYMVLVAEQHFVGSEVRVVSPAEPPTSPKSPNIPVFLAVAALLAPLAGCLVAMAKTHLLRKPNLKDVAKQLRLRSFGSVQVPSKIDFMPGARHRRALFWEEVRALRNSLKRPGEAGAVIALASVDPKSSASLLVASLGRAMASSGLRTLIIDLNLRKPATHAFLQVEPKETAGLGELLHGTIDRSDAVVPAGFNNSLFLLTSAKSGIRNIDMLGGRQLGMLIRDLRSSFDLVILDSPPVALVSDALSVAGLADGTLLVTRAAQARSAAFFSLISLLREQAVPLLGFVATDTASFFQSSPSADFKAYASDDPLARIRPFQTRRRLQAVQAPVDLSPAEIGLAAKRS